MAKKKLAPSHSADNLKALLSGLAHPKATVWLPTGIHALDLAIGGGLPQGRIIEAYGTESGGKTTLALMAIAAAQRMGGAGIYIDVETALDLLFAQKVGVDTDVLVYDDRWQKVGEVQKILVDNVTMIRKIAPNVPIVAAIDSIASLSAENEWVKDKASGQMVPNDNGQPGRRAKALSDLFRFYTGWVARNNVTLICVNQIRDKIGTMFGEKTDSPGGHALKFHASVRIRLNRGQKNQDAQKITESVDGHLHIKKNKVAPPFRTTTLKFNINRGFDRFAGLETLLVEAGRIKEVRKGEAFELNGQRFETKDLPEIVTANPTLLDPWV